MRHLDSQKQVIYFFLGNTDNWSLRSLRQNLRLDYPAVLGSSLSHFASEEFCSKGLLTVRVYKGGRGTAVPGKGGHAKHELILLVSSSTNP